jgi:hypothetical protein
MLKLPNQCLSPTFHTKKKGFVTYVSEKASSAVGGAGIVGVAPMIDT